MFQQNRFSWKICTYEASSYNIINLPKCSSIRVSIKFYSTNIFFKFFFVIIGEEIDFKGLNKNTSLDQINNLLKNYRESERKREKGGIRNRDIKKERER